MIRPAIRTSKLLYLHPVPAEQTALSEKERQAVQQVADQRGVSFEEAAEQMAKEGLASRVRRKTGRAPARVYDLSRKKT